MERINLKFYIEDKYKNDVTIPEIAYEGTSACFDLFAAETVTIKAHESACIPVGLRIMIPAGYYIKIADRSGNGIKKGLQAHAGIFDPGYSGEWKIKLFNLSNEDQVIEKGKGACQLEVHKIPPVTLSQASEEEWKEYCKQSVRGENGLGSSDKSDKTK